MSHTEGDVREPPLAADLEHRRGAAGRRHEQSLLSERLLGHRLRRPYERIVHAPAIRHRAFLRLQLDVAEAMAVEVGADELPHAIRILVGYETEVDLHHRLRRDDGLRAVAGEPGLE